MEPVPKITVLTVTLNASVHISQLAESLKKQTSQNFTWLVKDGGSTDNTIAIVNTYRKYIDIEVQIEEDDGIYSALNQGLKYIKTSHYVVAGADDFFFPEAIDNFSCEAQNYDIVCAPVVVNGRTKLHKPNQIWKDGISAALSSHSIGCLIRNELHSEFGLYKLEYRIVADQEFLLSVLHGGASTKHLSVPSGVYNLGGFSGSSAYNFALEFYKMNIKQGYNPVLQTLLLATRLTKGALKSVARATRSRFPR